MARTLLELELDGVDGAEALEVHRVEVREDLSAGWSVVVLARSADVALDLGGALGVRAGLRHVDLGRRWAGVCRQARLAEAVEVGEGEVGLSTYQLVIVPALWLLSRRTRYRIFQHRSTPSIVQTVLEEWGLDAATRWQLEQGGHPARPYRVQYGETDLDFVSRLLEEEGIAYRFDDEEERDGGTRLVLTDVPHASAPRRERALPHIERPMERERREYATRVSVTEELRPEAVMLRDHDFRRPTWGLVGEARSAPAASAFVECYAPGGFLVERDGDTDARHDDRFGAALAMRGLERERAGRCLVSFETNAADLRPGTIVIIEGHPHPALDPRVGLLLTSIAIDASLHDDWRIRAEAVPASTPFRPPRRIPKPRAHGLQSATVVGPAGQEIHTDEHGRVRVQFPWDREAQGSCWLRVAQGWAGAGLGMFALPRVGQEVLVGFLEGDPDQPVVVGRLSNPLNPPPLRLPDQQTQSVWRSGTSPGGEGYSEIRFEDRRGEELLSMRAERDMGIAVRRDRAEAVGGDETKRVEGRLVVYVGQDVHVTAEGEHRTRVGGKRSVTVDGDAHARVGGSAALEAGVIHLAADGAIVIEAADITLRGAGGFVRIDGGGVSIDGGAVRIQQGGGPAAGPGASPALPLAPQRADQQAPGPRRLPLLQFPGLPPLPAKVPRGQGGPLTLEEQQLCMLICLCREDPAPHKRPQDCVTARLRAMEEASGHTGKIKSEVPYDMTKTPPEPIMSRNDPRRATRRRPKDSKIPDVVIVKDGTGPPTQDNLEKVIEIKFPPDDLRPEQERYDDIAGPHVPFEVFDPERCGCRRRREAPQPQPQEQPQSKEEALAEAALLTLLIVALLLDDLAPGGQVDDVMIPPAIARIMSRLEPLLRGTAPVMP